MQNTFFLGKDIAQISKKQLAKLKQAAEKSPLKRARFCLHKSHKDMIQEMVIGFLASSYVRPHRHLNKSESFHIVQGRLTVVFFNEKGKVTKCVKLEPVSGAQSFLCRLAMQAWHMVIPCSPFVVVHEVTEGPFVKGETEYAPWSPDGQDLKRVTLFLKSIKAQCRR